MNVILMEDVVKGYHECPFTVRTGESFVFEKKIGFAVVLCVYRVNFPHFEILPLFRVKFLYWGVLYFLN